MRRHLYLYAVLIVAEVAGFGQDRSAVGSGESAGTEQQRQPATRVHRSPSDERLPAERYSPLAARGGYTKSRTSPLDAMIHALNPRDVNLGSVWEERRRVWLENAGAHRYFWYAFSATALLILSWFSLAWLHTDRVRERWQLAEHAADALRYAEYCKHRAQEAIGRYNEHVEKCNRVIEAEESGITTPETANLEDYRREIQRLKSDGDAKDLQVARLEEQLAQKSTQLNNLTERITEAERRLKNRAAPQENGNAALADRIQRLEAENRRLKRAKSPAAQPAAADNGSAEEN